MRVPDLIAIGLLVLLVRYRMDAVTAVKRAHVEAVEHSQDLRSRMPF